MKIPYPDRDKALNQVRRQLKTSKSRIGPTEGGYRLLPSSYVEPSVGLFQIAHTPVDWGKYQQGLEQMFRLSPPLYPPKEGP